jgi:hypothetical protein
MSRTQLQPTAIRGGPNKRALARVFAVLAVALVLTGLTSAVPASAQRPQPPYIPSTENPMVLEGYCPGFDVEVLFTDLNQFFVRETTVDGVTTLRVTGHAGPRWRIWRQENRSRTTSADPARS